MQSYNRKIFKKAVAISWLIVTVLMLVSVALPFFAENTVLASLPLCESRKLHGAECSACGLTSGFVKISKGDFSAAQSLNGSAVVVYAIFIMNICAFVYFTGRKLFIKQNNPLCR
jgi:hypothetical protein